MLIDGFNATCNNINASFLKVGDESMSAINFRATANRNLSHLSYIFCKPDPLGTDFKTVSCYITGSLIFIEFQRRKEVMKDIKYQKELGATAACTKRMMKATKGIGQKSIMSIPRKCAHYAQNCALITEDTLYP